MLTVGDILEGREEGQPKSAEAVQRVMPARHPHQPEFPQPGIYFRMPESVYHAINACSASGLKWLAVSSMDHHANSPMNLDREDEDTEAKALGRAYHVRICEGPAAFAERYAIALDKADYPDALVTMEDLRKAIAEAGEKPKGTRKDDVAAQLLAISPDAQIWDAMVAEHGAEHAGKTFISAKQHRRVEIAAKMIEAHPELKDAFRGGWAEVSLFYFCPVTGAPMKSRLDYLKHDAINDLKSFANKQGLPIDRAIERVIASLRYNVQHVVYDDAVAAVRRLVRERGSEAVFGTDEQIEWALRWARQTEPPAFMFVFQQTGMAPVTRGKIMPREPMGVFGVTQSRVMELKRSYVANSEVYGVEPWLDIKPVEWIDDADIPLYATEI